MKTLKKGCIGYDVKVLQRMLHLIDDGVFGPITEEAVMMFQHEHGLTALSDLRPGTPWLQQQRCRRVAVRLRRLLCIAQRRR